jgi:hypothetical protein
MKSSTSRSRHHHKRMMFNPPKEFLDWSATAFPYDPIAAHPVLNGYLTTGADGKRTYMHNRVAQTNSNVPTATSDQTAITALSASATDSTSSFNSDTFSTTVASTSDSSSSLTTRSSPSSASSTVSIASISQTSSTVSEQTATLQTSTIITSSPSTSPFSTSLMPSMTSVGEAESTASGAHKNITSSPLFGVLLGVIGLLLILGALLLCRTVRLHKLRQKEELDSDNMNTGASPFLTFLPFDANGDQMVDQKLRASTPAIGTSYVTQSARPKVDDNLEQSYSTMSVLEAGTLTKYGHGLKVMNRSDSEFSSSTSGSVENPVPRHIIHTADIGTPREKFAGNEPRWLTVIGEPLYRSPPEALVLPSITSGQELAGPRSKSRLSDSVDRPGLRSRASAGPEARHIDVPAPIRSLEPGSTPPPPLATPNIQQQGSSLWGAGLRENLLAAVASLNKKRDTTGPSPLLPSQSFFDSKHYDVVAKETPGFPFGQIDSENELRRTESSSEKDYLKMPTPLYTPGLCRTSSFTSSVYSSTSGHRRDVKLPPVKTKDFVLSPTDTPKQGATGYMGRANTPVVVQA